MNPESAQAIRNGRYQSLALRAYAAADALEAQQKAEWAAHQKPAPLSMSMFASKADYDKAMGDTVPCNAPTDTDRKD